MRILLLPLMTLMLACSGNSYTQAVAGEPIAAGEAGEVSEPGVSGGAGENHGGAATGGGDAAAGEQSGGDVTGGTGGSYAGSGDSGGSGGVVTVGGASGEAGGTGGVMTDPDIDECAEEEQLICDDLCGEDRPDDICSCGVISMEGRVVLGGQNNDSNVERNCGCPGATLRLRVQAMQCARFTAQPGSNVSFSDASCGSRTEQCVIVSGLVDGAGTERTVMVSRPSQNAWVQQESVDLVMGKCPLSCD